MIRGSVVKRQMGIATACLAAIAGLVSSGAAEARPIPPPPGIDAIVTPGAFCSSAAAGTIAKTTTGLGMVCSYLPGDIRYRWRELDSSTNPIVGSVDRLYSAYFLRQADAGGFAYWIGLYVRGIPIGAISENFALSSEFQGRYGALSNLDFVRLVYNNVLNRQPDAAGYAYWVDLLDRIVIHRGQMMVGFSESPEYKAKTATV